MITIYAESPYLLQIALRQEHSRACEDLLDRTDQRTIEIAVPIVALVEPLTTWRLRVSDRARVGEEWRKQARELARTDSPIYKDAAAALQEALLKTAAMDDEERGNIDAAIARVSAKARLMPFKAELFAAGYAMEARTGLTSIDALAAVTILADDARPDPAGERVFLSLDKKSYTAAALEEFRSAGVQVFHQADALTGWLGARAGAAD